MATPIPPNHASFRVEDVAALASGTILASGGAPGTACEGVSTDSRGVTKGELFIALAGDRFDAHDYLAVAVERGASALLVHRQVDVEAIGRVAHNAGVTLPAVVRVADTRVALGLLAQAHRRRWAGAPHASGPRRVVAITGSAGKTTTKVVAARLLEGAAPNEVHSTEGNLNNDVGVPMTLFGLEPQHRLAVLEVGTSRRGEIAQLARIVEPEVAVVTLVAAAHTEGLGSVDDVALEKGDLLASLPANGTAIANADDVRAHAQLTRSPASVRHTYGFAEAADYRITGFQSTGATGSSVVVTGPTGRFSLPVPLLGRSGALAVAAGIAVTDALLGRPLTPNEALGTLAKLANGIEGRLKPLHLHDGTLVLDDTYNANPASMRSSIQAAAQLAHDEGRRLVLVLGEMRELGAASASEHETLGRSLSSLDAASVAFVLGISGEMVRLVDAARAASLAAAFATDVEQAIRLLAVAMRAGDVVLIKGSRGVRTEGVVAHLLAGSRRETR